MFSMLTAIQFSRFPCTFGNSTFLNGSFKFQNGRRVLLQLLHPDCSRYLSPDDLAALKLSIPSLCAKVIRDFFSGLCYTSDMGLL